MTNGNNNIGSLTADIDPVSGLVSYVQEVKPYHTKILEVLVEYIHTDCIDVTITEDWKIDIGMPSDFSKWGWNQETAETFFNCGLKNYQISDINVSGGYFLIDGDYASDFEAGEKVLAAVEDSTVSEYTVIGTVVVSKDITINAGSSPDRVSGTIYSTKVLVSEAIPVWFGVGSPRTYATGVMFHSSCYLYDSLTNTYTFKVGIVWPSPRFVENNQDCGGWGSIFQQAKPGPQDSSPATGSPGPGVLPGGAGNSNVILSANSEFHYFEIDNTILPPDISSWENIYGYGIRITVEGSTGNNGEYTVLVSVPITDASPLGTTGILRIYTIENIASDIADGSLYAKPWGYDEPTVCYDPGQSLAAEAHLSENAQMVVNDIQLSLFEGWDMHYWDVGAWDGSFTYTIEFN